MFSLHNFSFLLSCLFFLFQVESYMSHDWPFMVITVRQLIYVRRRLGYPSFTKMISSSPACKVEYLKSLHREWQILAAISCVSHARECIPVHGYESCACYSLCHCWIITSWTTSGGWRKDRNTSGQRRNKFSTSYRDISVIVGENNSVVRPNISSIRLCHGIAILKMT